MAQKRSTTTLTLAPLDNRALSNLCGPLDANLRQIEAACDVTITHRGGAFTIAGVPAPAARARAATEGFYAAAEKPLSVDDIQLGLVEIATRGTRMTPAAAGDDDVPALRTRRADLHGRCPHGVPRRVEEVVVVDERVALDAERERLSAASKDIVGSYNERAAALEARVKEWNRRNEELNKAGR